MKKIILSIILLLSFTAIFAQDNNSKFNNFKFGFDAEAGYNDSRYGIHGPLEAFGEDYDRVVLYYGPLYSDITLKVLAWNKLYIETSIKEIFSPYVKENGKLTTQFVPLLATYTTTFEFRATKSITLGYSHYCTHPIYSSPDDNDSFKFRAGEDRIYVRLTIGDI